MINYFGIHWMLFLPSPIKKELIWPRSTAFPCENSNVYFASWTQRTCMHATLNIIISILICRDWGHSIKIDKKYLKIMRCENSKLHYEN